MPWQTVFSKDDYSVRPNPNEGTATMSNHKIKHRYLIYPNIIRDACGVYGRPISPENLVQYCIDKVLIPHPIDELV